MRLFFRAWFGWGLFLSEFAIQNLPPEFREAVLRPFRTDEKSRISEELTAIGNVPSVVIYVRADSRGVGGEPLVYVVVKAEPVENIVVDWSEPGNALSHSLTEAIAHMPKLGVGVQNIFAVFRSTPLRLSAKLLRQSSVITRVYHAPGSTRVHNEKTPGLPRQREPGAWPTMHAL